MISRWKEKLQAWNQQTVRPAEEPVMEATTATPEPVEEKTTEAAPSEESTSWTFAWVIPDGVYYCGLDRSVERLNQLVGLYEHRAILDGDKLMGYCTFGELDLVSLSRERILKLDQRFQQCSVALAAARVLWQYGILTLDNAVSIQQGDLTRFPPAVVQLLNELSIGEADPAQETVPLTQESLTAAVETGEGISTLSTMIARLSDSSSVRRVTYWLSHSVTSELAERALPLVDSLVACPVAKGLMPVANDEQGRAEALAKINPDQLNLLQNLYSSVHLWVLEAEKTGLVRRMDALNDQYSALKKILPERPKPLWLVKQLRALDERVEALNKRIAPLKKVQDGVTQRYVEKEKRRVQKQFQTLCQSELDEAAMHQLCEWITGCKEEQPLQEMAGTILALGLVVRYPEETQQLSGYILSAVSQLPGLNVAEQMTLSAIKERLDTLDNISRLYLLSENQMIDAQVTDLEAEIQHYTSRLSDGSLSSNSQVEQVQNGLDDAEKTLEELRGRQTLLHEMVAQLGSDRPERGGLLSLIASCIEEGPAARLARVTPMERTLIESVGLDGLMDQLLQADEQVPSPLLYAVLLELQRLWEPMMAHGYYFVGYGIGPREPFKGGLDKERYHCFTKTLKGTEQVEMVFPLFVNCLRQYANRYDWVRGFGEGSSMDDPEGKAKVRAVLKALTEGRYTDYLDMFDAPECYARHAGRGLERFNVLKQLGQVIATHNASLQVKDFAEGEAIKRRLDMASVLLQNEAYRAINLMNKEEQ